LLNAGKDVSLALC